MKSMNNSFNNMTAFSQKLLEKDSEVVTGSAIEVDENLLDILSTMSENLVWCKTLLYLVVLAIVVFAVFSFFYYILSRFLYDGN